MTVDTLKNELINSNEDAEQAHGELEQLRLRASDSQKHTSEEATSREMALRDAQEDLERVRMEKEEWEGEAMRERVRSDELAVRLGQVEMELAAAKGERELLREERDREAESAANLHAVLEEFQAGEWPWRWRDDGADSLGLGSQGTGARVDVGRPQDSSAELQQVSCRLQAARNIGRGASCRWRCSKRGWR